MNDRLLEILSARTDFSLSPEDKKLLDIFVEYLDHGSLFLSGFEPSVDDGSSNKDERSSNNPVFNFTNEAQHYRFSMSQIREHVLGLKQGRAMDWEGMPFEYVNRGQV
jgi:hypothetical protein